jgi:hypothetical protein
MSRLFGSREVGKGRRVSRGRERVLASWKPGPPSAFGRLYSRTKGEWKSGTSWKGMQVLGLPLPSDHRGGGAIEGEWVVAEVVVVLVLLLVATLCLDSQLPFTKRHSNRKVSHIICG